MEPKSTYLKVSSYAWPLIWDTLELDCQSTAFEPSLREELVAATSSVTEIAQGYLELQLMADISTVHVTPKDGKLLQHSKCSYVLAETRGGYGTILYLGDDIVAMRQTLTAEGFSPHFCAVIEEAHRMRVNFVRFDADGRVYKHLPKFEW